MALPSASGSPSAAELPPAVAEARSAKAALSDAGVEVDVDDARAMVAAARSALVNDLVDDAQHLVTAALALDPENAQGWVLQGDVAWQRNDAAAARDAWQEALSLDDKDLVTALRCARAQLALDDVRPARALLTFVVARTRSDELRDEAEALLEQTDDQTETAAAGATR